MMRIAVDAMGGDHAPAEIVAGAVMAAGQLEGEIILVGREPEVRAELTRLGPTPRNIVIHHADQVVEMDESPRLALRQKAGSSVTVCVDLVRGGQADAAISAGNSGALMAAATMRLGTLPGVQRPAIAILLPTRIGLRIVADAGANVDCKPEHLADFALMGSVYAEHALGISRPRVGILSIGTESSKGNELSLAAYKLVSELPVNFIGNIEGNQIPEGEVDVTVCDGFAGNVVLKVVEGTAMELSRELKEAAKANVFTRLAALMMRSALNRVARKYDYAEHGGALLLGTNGVCIVSHGCSDRRAMSKAIEAAARSVQTGVQQRMTETFSRRQEMLASAQA